MDKLTVGIFSDLHLDIEGLNWFEYLDAPKKKKIDLWIIAGDVHPESEKRDEWFKYHFEGNVPVFFIMGNHDFWDGHEISSPEDYCKEIDINGFKIAGAPLWTDLARDPMGWMLYTQTMNDRKNMNSNWTEEFYNHHFKVQRDYLLKSKADIIVSHHLPSIRSVSENHRMWPNNVCYYTELTPRVDFMDPKPLLWVHGHSHVKMDYVMNEKTRVINHARGYPHEYSAANFNPYTRYQPKIVTLVK